MLQADIKMYEKEVKDLDKNLKDQKKAEKSAKQAYEKADKARLSSPSDAALSKAADSAKLAWNNETSKTQALAN